MDFTLSERETYFRDRVKTFIDQQIRPRQDEHDRQHHEGERWKVLPVIEEVKEIAKAQGLWNFFMPPHSGQQHVDDSFEFEGTQLTNLEYALCAEEMGKIGWASECFNCSAPDTGNMEVFHRYGTREQKESLAEAADGGQDPLRLPDDRACGGIVGRDQHRDADGPRRRSLRHQRHQMVVERGRRSALRRRDRDGQDQPRCETPRAAEPDPGAA